MDLAIFLADRGIDPAWTSHNGVPAVVAVANSDEELTEYLALAKRLADRKVVPVGWSGQLASVLFVRNPLVVTRRRGLPLAHRVAICAAKAMKE